tara:strand:- start:191 stop:730 length:540 start_codon:yes stop_codon:yes gene_type:complete
MAYNVKDVFYLDVAVDTGTGTGANTKQLDLSSYIDPIARRGSKAQGLAIYKVQTSFTQGNNSVVDKAEDGSMRYGLIAGLGAGDQTGISLTADTITADNDLCVAAGDYYGPATADSAANGMFLMPDADVPYIVVRDNACLVVDIDDDFNATITVGMRLSCAVVTLDQSTLNQLLRTQTV